MIIRYTLSFENQGREVLLSVADKYSCRSISLSYYPAVFWAEMIAYHEDKQNYSDYKHYVNDLLFHIRFSSQEAQVLRLQSH